MFHAIYEVKQFMVDRTFKEGRRHGNVRVITFESFNNSHLASLFQIFFEGFVTFVVRLIFSFDF